MNDHDEAVLATVRALRDDEAEHPYLVRAPRYRQPDDDRRVRAKDGRFGAVLADASSRDGGASPDMTDLRSNLWQSGLHDLVEQLVAAEVDAIDTRIEFWTAEQERMTAERAPYIEAVRILQEQRKAIELELTELLITTGDFDPATAERGELRGQRDRLTAHLERLHARPVRGTEKISIDMRDGRTAEGALP
jgi:hypothetical protein